MFFCLIYTNTVEYLLPTPLKAKILVVILFFTQSFYSSLHPIAITCPTGSQLNGLIFTVDNGDPDNALES